jgi:hypothetical protein
MEVMPTREEAEAGLAALDPIERNKWLNFQRTWFYSGLPATLQVALRTNDGVKVDGEKAFRHLHVIQGSFAPQHEHKEAAVAYLASLWFEDVAWEGFDLEEEASTTT